MTVPEGGGAADVQRSGRGKSSIEFRMSHARDSLSRPSPSPGTARHGRPRWGGAGRGWGTTHVRNIWCSLYFLIYRGHITRRQSRAPSAAPYNICFSSTSMQNGNFFRSIFLRQQLCIPNQPRCWRRSTNLNNRQPRLRAPLQLQAQSHDRGVAWRGMAWRSVAWHGVA